jgi:hypothetical protein
MPTRTFNPVPVFTGLAVVVMILAGVLLTAAHSSVSSEVGDLLTAQKIYFPPASSPQVTKLPAADATAMTKYAGQLMTNGSQAEIYAEHFLPSQIYAIAGGQSYSQLGAKLTNAGHDRALFVEQADLFREQAIQGQLLNTYWFSQVGQIMLFGAIAAFVGAAVLLILAAIGLARRVAVEAETLLKPVLQPAAETA